MPAFFPSLKETHQEWIMKQPIFFVASAPLVGRHVNVSPKGHPSRTLRILSPNKIAYLDHTGSGCETVAHMYEPGNRRLTVMLNSFGPSPLIMRLFCTGKVMEKGTPGYADLISLFDRQDDNEKAKPINDKDPDIWQQDAIRHGARSVILLDVFKVQTSCGYGVPVLEASIPADRAATLSHCERDESGCWLDRETLPMWANKLQDDKLTEYWMKNNARSLDGLPGLKRARWEAGEILGISEVKLWFRNYVLGNLPSVFFGFMLAVLALLWTDLLRVDEIYEQGTNLWWNKLL